MYADQLIDIGKQIGTLEQANLRLTSQIGAVQHQMEDQERRITPVGGWPGSNADQRKAAQAQALQDDSVLYDMRERMDQLKRQIAENAALLAPLEAERRALEYAVKDRQADSNFSVADLVVALMNAQSAPMRSGAGTANAVSQAPSITPSTAEVRANRERQIMGELGFGKDDTAPTTSHRPAPVRTAVPVTKDTTIPAPTMMADANDNPF